MNSTNIPFAAALLAIMVLCASACGPHLPSVEELGPLDRRIPPADRDKYKSIRDGKDYVNPRVVVYPDCILIEAQGVPSNSGLVPVSRLKEVLVALPVNAWPYGRVVAVSNASISGSLCDLASNRQNSAAKERVLIRQNREAVERVLKELGVTVDGWPS